MTIFYQKNLSKGVNFLSEEESKHCSQVLRHKKGDEIMVFDGIGGRHRSILTQVSKKNCEFEIIESFITPEKKFRIHLAIAPTKNMERMEWLVEKLSEIGVDQITFIQTQHSERKKLRIDRLEKKAISAMKQSGNPFLLKLSSLTPLKSFLAECASEVKLIAHVDDSNCHINDQIKAEKGIAILIGPEGDFSLAEVQQAKGSGFTPVSLGQNTFRTETAGFVACCFVNAVNKF